MENDQNKKYGPKPGAKKPCDRKPREGGEGKKPYAKKPNEGGEGRKPYAKKPYEGGDGKKPFVKKPNEGGEGRKPYAGGPSGDNRRPDWSKTYDKVPPREDVRAAAPAALPEEDDDEEHMDEDSGLVIGRNAVRELLRSDRTVDKLLVRRGDREGSITVLVAEAIDKGIPVVEVDKTKLDDMAGFVPHQGVIAMVAQKEYVTVEDILAIAEERGEAPLIVIADGITDPYNLGALIRCAEGVGAHGLIIPRRRAVGLTALVAKSSAGAMEHLAVAKVANIAATIQTLKKAGIWCYAAEAGGKAYYETDFKGPCALVFGSEGNGVSHIVKETCDAIVSIPMYGKVNSFNVSTAAAVILSEAAKQHRS